MTPWLGRAGERARIRREGWEEAARRLAADVLVPGGNRDPTLRLHRPRWTTTLGSVYEGDRYVTRVRAPFWNPSAFRMVVRDEGLLDDILKTLGFLQDVEVGEEAFDERFLVKGYPAWRIRELLGPAVRERLRGLPRVDLRIEPLSRTGAGARPGASPGVGSGGGSGAITGVDALVFRVPPDFHQPDRVVAVFRVFDLLMEGLVPVETGERGALEARLGAPGGVIRHVPLNYVVWDGDRPRRDAARELGALGDPAAVPALLSVLDDDAEGVVAAALEALGRIGDPGAVPALVRALGRRQEEVDGTTLSETAASALEAVGEGGTASAFRRALGGDPTGVAALGSRYRGELVRALMDVVDSADFSARVHAARALGTLGARDALPLLRSRSRAWGMKTRLTEAASEAVAAIEARARLPRPADQPAVSDPSTLPRPASSGDAGDAGER
jgi:hypothetical protein